MKKLLITLLILVLSFAVFANDFTGKLFEVKSGPKEYKSLVFQFLESEIIVCDTDNGSYARYPYRVSGSTIFFDEPGRQKSLGLFNEDSIQYKISDGTAKVELFNDELSIVLYDIGRKQYRSDLAFEILDKATITTALIAGASNFTRNQVSKESYKITEETRKFYDVDKYVRSHNGEAPSGFKGGDAFKNFELRLPTSDNNGNLIQYWEYDVNPFVKGVNRGAERLVLGSDGNSYMTIDHYTSFQPLY